MADRAVSLAYFATAGASSQRSEMQLPESATDDSIRSSQERKGSRCHDRWYSHRSERPREPGFHHAGWCWELVAHGHTVLVESCAGDGSGFADEAYARAGAQICQTHAGVFEQADMVVKVKEPVPAEYNLLRENQLLFTYLHLAADEQLTRALMDRTVQAVAYETVQLPNRSLPLLTPMSEVAGRMSVQVGAHYLQRNEGGLWGAPWGRAGRRSGACRHHRRRHRWHQRGANSAGYGRERRHHRSECRTIAAARSGTARAVDHASLESDDHRRCRGEC